MRFSVVIPVYQQWDMIEGLLEAMAKQTLGEDCFDIIVTDNGSRHTPAAPSMPLNGQVLNCAIPGSYAARNFGAQHARGDWLVFTDADCRPTPRWLETLAEAIEKNPNASLFAGAIRMTVPSGHPTPWAIYDAVKGIPQQEYVAKGYAATANLAVSRELFLRLSGFDAARLSGGDAEFCRRAGATGAKLVYVPEAIVDHPARADWGALATKARRVRGGQMVPGTPLRYKLGGLLPPLPIAMRMLADTRHPLHHRIIAACVQWALWGVQLGETVRLAVGGRPERR